MSRTIRLEVAAVPSAFAPIRLVLGGLGARLGLSVDELDDVFLATEALFRAAISEEKDMTRFRMELCADDGTLRSVAGPFVSATLRQRIAPAAPDVGCLDLCRVLHATCDDVRVEEAAGAYRVVLVKAPGDRA
ncbi:MAG TPA: hypothetical protein PLB30_03225 [Thermoleophilia bacterium]|nr:hypothetical protein [Thermoleophilia bacterium]HQG03379.1 hypothetical protein [Thermoleophilia bacterium]HQG54647.1 hypothetical protein [Thermoleophilia bacterium]HQJ97549.1 hypothetical protein [Thermoleophilia bacterium]